MFDGTGRKINLFVRDFLQRGVRRGAELSCATAEKMLLILTSWNLDTRASWKHLRSLDWIRYIRLPCIACRFPFQYVPVHPSVLQVFKLWFGMIWPCALWFSPVLWKGTYGILWPESVLHLTDSAEQLGIAASGFKSRSSCHFDPSRREKAWSHCEDEDSRHFQSSNSPLNISQPKVSTISKCETHCFKPIKPRIANDFGNQTTRIEDAYITSLARDHQRDWNWMVSHYFIRHLSMHAACRGCWDDRCWAEFKDEILRRWWFFKRV